MINLMNIENYKKSSVSEQLDCSLNWSVSDGVESEYNIRES